MRGTTVIDGEFRLEREMLPRVGAWLRDQDLEVRAEFSLPWGVCDLVAASLSLDRCLERLALGQKRPIGTPLRVAILEQIPDRDVGRGRQDATLRRNFEPYVDGARVDREVVELMSRGFVERSSRGSLAKRNGWYPLQDRLVTVELKLSRTQEALAQAAAHRAMGAESFVALPAALAMRVASDTRSAAFRHRGVGLLAVSDAGCEVLIPACQPSPTDRVAEMHAIERIWRTWVKGQRACVAGQRSQGVEPSSPR